MFRVPTHKFLRFINLFIGLVLVAALGGVYWFAWRPLPRTSGNLPAPLGARATVTRDSLGVPHITAGSLEDALFVQGFVTAQDRLWQMDTLRRLPAGRVAEMIGPAGLEMDQEARRLGLRRIAEQHARSLPDADRRALAAYARGVNHFIETNRDRLPLEFTLLQYDPHPWSIADTILIGMEMAKLLSGTWKDEVRKLQMMQGGEPAKVNYLFPVRSGLEGQPGSNAWVISGKLTAGGRPILANDPHLEYSVPCVWYMVHLKAPELNVQGVALPGVPGVIIGHNERIAWGMTNLHFDVQDLYEEKIDLRTGRYLYRGQVEQARSEQEIISVKGARPVQLNIWVTRHGPVFLTEGGKAYSLRWAPAESEGFAFPFLDINRARNWTEFRAALARFPGPAQNFVYADVDGNIGYQAAGRLPVRKSYAGDQPVDGASGNFEWDGLIPFDALPTYYNPPSGMIVTANQNPFPADYPYPVSGKFAPGYRYKQIRAMLTARKDWKPADMLIIQKDVYSSIYHFLARRAVAAYDSRGIKNADLGEAIGLLREWNGQMEAGQAAPVLAALLYQQLRQALGERASPGKGLTYEYLMGPAAVEGLLRKQPGDWFPDYDQLVLGAFLDAVEQGKRKLGASLGKWDYGQFQSLTLAHPIAGKLPLVGKYFNVGPVPMSGSAETVKQVRNQVGPSMRMALEPGNWDGSFQNITLGQSGHLLSPHYKDQWKPYYNGTGVPVQFNGIEAKSTLTMDPM